MSAALAALSAVVLLLVLEHRRVNLGGPLRRAAVRTHTRTDSDADPDADSTAACAGV